jgi:hypothetical protein
VEAERRNHHSGAWPRSRLLRRQRMADLVAIARLTMQRPPQLAASSL